MVVSGLIGKLLADWVVHVVFIVWDIFTLVTFLLSNIAEIRTVVINALVLQPV